MQTRIRRCPRQESRWWTGRENTTHSYRIHTPQGLCYSADVEEPPPDKAYLFDHWGAGGNTGVSGQQCLPAGAASPTHAGGSAVGGGVGGGGEYVPWAYQPLVSEPAPKLAEYRERDGPREASVSTQK